MPYKPALTKLPSLGSVPWQFTLSSSTLMNYKLTTILHVQQINFILEHSLLSNYQHHNHLRHGPTPTLHIVTKSWNSACSISHTIQSNKIMQQNLHTSERISEIIRCVQQTDMLPIFLSRQDNIRHTCIVSYLGTLCCFSSIVSSWLSGGLILNRQQNLRLLLLLGDSAFQPAKVCTS